MSTHLLAAVAAGVLSATASGPASHVHITAAPEGALAGLRTFAVSRIPEYIGRIEPGADDPLLLSQATNRAVRKDVIAAFERQGYVLTDSRPDVMVSYYVAVPPRLDVTSWDYGYLWRPQWWRDWGPGNAGATQREYDDGAVIVDVQDVHTGNLLWRGHSVTDTPTDQRIYIRDLGHTVAAIVRDFPARSAA